jgi:hypothetical protein
MTQQTGRTTTEIVLMILAALSALALIVMLLLCLPYAARDSEDPQQPHLSTEPTEQATEPEETGLILETMAYLSNIGVRSAVYDVVLAGKLSRDEDSVAMLDIIYDDINIDLLYVYRFANAPDAVYTSITNGDPFASAYESIRPMMEEEIRTFIENVEGE